MTITLKFVSLFSSAIKMGIPHPVEAYSIEGEEIIEMVHCHLLGIF
jgi:hypothetical protein